MLHSRIHFRGRCVDQITSEEGQRNYYDLFDCWRSCVANTNPLRKPSVDDAKEYIKLKAIKDKLAFGSRMYRRFEVYDSRYDWRPRKTETNGLYGLAAPDGTQLLPEKFLDVFTNFDAINHPLPFVPVSNGNGWALVSLSSPPILMTNFIYNTIIPEHFEHSMYFVQDKTTMKWGAFETTYGCIDRGHGKKGMPMNMGISMLREIMPPIADEIYEDELMDDCSLTLFWMTRIGDKIGILTPYGYSKIIYDKYETDNDKLQFRLFRDGRKKAKLIDYSFFKYKP